MSSTHHPLQVGQQLSLWSDLRTGAREQHQILWRRLPLQQRLPHRKGEKYFWLADNYNCQDICKVVTNTLIPRQCRILSDKKSHFVLYPKHDLCWWNGLLQIYCKIIDTGPGKEPVALCLDKHCFRSQSKYWALVWPIHERVFPVCMDKQWLFVSLGFRLWIWGYILVCAHAVASLH